MNQDLLERYLYAVTRGLPKRQREDVAQELRAWWRTCCWIAAARLHDGKGLAGCTDGIGHATGIV